MTLTLVIPCYKDGAHLKQNVEHVLEILGLTALPFEILLVDDASPDDTGLVADEIASSLGEGRIRVIHHSRNLGRGAAFLSGAQEARGDIVGFFDIDLEVAPVYLVECIRVIEREDADLVIGQRHYQVTFSLIYRHILSASYAWLVSRILKLPKGIDSESGYKFFKRSVLEQYLGTFSHAGWFWDTEVVSRFFWDGRKVRGVPCLFIRNGEKTSTVKPLRDALVYARNLFSYWLMGRKLRRKGLEAEELAESLHRETATPRAKGRSRYFWGGRLPERLSKRKRATESKATAEENTLPPPSPTPLLKAAPKTDLQKTSKKKLLVIV